MLVKTLLIAQRFLEERPMDADFEPAFRAFCLLPDHH